MSVGRLVVDFVANTLGFETDTKRAARNADKAAKDMQKSFSRMSTGITRAFAGIGVGLSFAAIIKNTADAGREFAQLEATIKSTGGAAGFTAAQLRDQADALEKVGVTLTGDIQRGMARLLTYTEVTGERFKEATQAALDMSTALGVDMTSAAETVGKALNYPSRALGSLSDQGFVFTEEQKKLIKSLEQTGRLAEAQGIILDELNNSYANSAKAARETLGGALSALRNTFSSLLTVDNGVPGITQAINAFTDALGSPALKGAFDSVVGGGLKVMADAAMGAITAFQKLGTAIGASAAAAVQVAKLNFSEAAEIWRQATADNLKVEAEYLAFREKLWNDSGQRIAATAAKGAPGIDDSAVPSSEGFTKLSAQLERQIALYGKVGEAAKIAYDIQSGALDAMTADEQKQALALARRYDAVVASANAQKQAEDAQKNAADSIQNLTAQLEQQVATYGKSEAEVIAYRIAHGDLADTFAAAGPALDEYRQKLIEVTEQIETQRIAEEALQKAESDRQEMMDRGARLTESLRTPLESYGDTLEELNVLLDEGAIDYETYSRAMKKAQEDLDKAIGGWGVFRDQAARNTQDIIADTLTDGFNKGVKGILDSFADMLIKMAAQAAAANIAEKIFGKEGSGGGLLDTAFGALGGLFGGGRATGGPVNAGMIYRVNEREPEFFRPRGGGDVIPLSKMSLAPAMSQPVTQNIYVQGRVDQRSARQIELEASRRQNAARARLG